MGRVIAVLGVGPERPGDGHSAPSRAIKRAVEPDRADEVEAADSSRCAIASADDLG